MTSRKDIFSEAYDVAFPHTHENNKALGIKSAKEFFSGETIGGSNEQ